MTVNVEWVGHACFRIWQDEESVIVTDPFSPSRLGLPDGPAVEGDIVIVSSLEDVAHGCPDLVQGSPRVINALDLVQNNQQAEVNGTPIVTLGAAESPFHESGHPKDNALYAFNVGGLWILHLGDLGHGLNSSELEVFQNKCDILLAIVGQSNTLSLQELDVLIEKLKPNWIIPMHYLLWWPSKMRPLKEFLDRRAQDTLVYLRSSTAKFSGLSSGLKKPEILVLEASLDPRRMR
ncbi:MAG: MBL fold metallo-hydrolase [Acidobacteriia bacterium]|nr:MBL fold metallo-hydrolase [Terriglobia bacterium]